MFESACGLQTSGEAKYTSDIGLGGSELHAAPVLSMQALATLEDIDASRALKVPPHSYLAKMEKHHPWTFCTLPVILQCCTCSCACPSIPIEPFRPCHAVAGESVRDQGEGRCQQQPCVH